MTTGQAGGRQCDCCEQSPRVRVHRLLTRMNNIRITSSHCYLGNPDREKTAVVGTKKGGMEDGTCYSVGLVSLGACFKVQVSRPCRLFNTNSRRRRRSTSTADAFPFWLDSNGAPVHVGDVERTEALHHHDSVSPFPQPTVESSRRHDLGF